MSPQYALVIVPSTSLFSSFGPSRKPCHTLSSSRLHPGLRLWSSSSLCTSLRRCQSPADRSISAKKGEWFCVGLCGVVSCSLIVPLHVDQPTPISILPSSRLLLHRSTLCSCPSYKNIVDRDMNYGEKLDHVHTEAEYSNRRGVRTQLNKVTNSPHDLSWHVSGILLVLTGLCSPSPAYHKADTDGLADLYVLVAIGLGAAVDELRAVLDEVLLNVEELCYLVGHFVYGRVEYGGNSRELET